MASPGCFATTIELALLPLARAGLLRGAVHVVGITGSSGSGVVPSAGTHHPVRAVNLKSYKPLEHQHMPEIEQTLADAGRRPGAASSCASCRSRRRCRAGSWSPASSRCPPARPGSGWRRATSGAYAGEPFVRFLERSPARGGGGRRGRTTPRSASPWGRPEGATRTLAVQAATDNLIKGGAGQAIQNMNLMLGLPETLSLEDPGPVAVSAIAAAGALRGEAGRRRAGGSGARPGGGGAGAGRRALRGARLVVVHGGGAQVTALSTPAGPRDPDGGRPAHHRRRHRWRCWRWWWPAG